MSGIGSQKQQQLQQPVGSQSTDPLKLAMATQVSAPVFFRADLTDSSKQESKRSVSELVRKNLLRPAQKLVFSGVRRSENRRRNGNRLAEKG